MLTPAKSKYINAASVAGANAVYTGTSRQAQPKKIFFFSPKLSKT